MGTRPEDVLAEIDRLHRQVTSWRQAALTRLVLRAAPAAHGISIPGSASERRRYAVRTVFPGTDIALQPQPWRGMPATAWDSCSLSPLHLPTITSMASFPCVLCLASGLAPLRPWRQETPGRRQRTGPMGVNACGP